MSLFSIVEVCALTVAQQLRHKTKRRRSVIRRRLGVQHLEPRMMLDAQTDYDNAISADDAAYQVIAGPALQQFGNTIESDEAARDADLQAGQDDLQKTVDSQEATVTSAENAADSTEQSAEDSADQAAQTLEQQANDQAAQLVAGFQAAEAASDAKAEADFRRSLPIRARKTPRQRQCRRITIRSPLSIKASTMRRLTPTRRRIKRL